MADAHDEEADQQPEEDEDYEDDEEEEDYSDDYEEDEDDESSEECDDDEEEVEEEEESRMVPLSHPKIMKDGKIKGSALELPTMVQDELERRRRGDCDAKAPPNPLVVHALRQYFESGKGDPMISGGFMTLMREIGAVAQSKDHLVKHSEHNIWYLGAKGEEDTNEWWQDQLERHEAEVRLLRYGEFMEMQEIKGLSFDKDNWKFDPLDDKEDLVGEDSLKEDGEPLSLDDDQKPTAKSNNHSPTEVVNDNVITKKQQEGLSKHFMASFVQYVDQDNEKEKMDSSEEGHANNATKVNGRQDDQQSHSQQPAQRIQQESDVITEETIRQKCRQLHKRYKENNGRPLGSNYVNTDQEPAGGTAKKLSGKKNRRRQRQHKAKNNLVGNNKRKEHAECIQEHIHSLVALWDQQLLVRSTPSAACARMVSSMMEMLTAAVKVDIEVVRSLATATVTTTTKNNNNNNNNNNHHKVALVELRERVIGFAIEADANMDRSLEAANAWWKLYADLTMFLADVIVTLTGDKENRNEYRTTAATPLTPDEKLASKLFETAVSPSLLESIQSPYAAVRCAALKALGRIVCGVSVELAMVLVKQKSKWDILEEACRRGSSMTTTANTQSNNDSKKSNNSNTTAAATTYTYRAKRRDEIVAPRSSAQATALLIRLCGTGMIKEDSDGPPGMTIIPGPLARKMIQRGIVPFLMELSRSENALISAEAVGGLAQVSCVKDCRVSLLEQPDVVPWLQSVLSSPEGNKVSQAILLSRHLLWDDDWLSPLLSIEPPIEQTIVKWAAFCMKCIRDRADETRIASKRLADEFMARSLSKIKLSDDNIPQLPENDKDLEADIQEMESRLSTALAWNKLETDAGRTHVTNVTLSRSVIFLSTLIRDKVTSERVLKSNCLALGAACLDVPVDDTNSAAANIIGNYLATAGSVSPNAFPDPDHVVRAAISRLSRLVNRQDITPRSFIFVRLLNGLRKSVDWAPFFQSCADQDMEHKYVIEVFLPKIGDNIPSTTTPPPTNKTKTPRRGSDTDKNNVKGATKNGGHCVRNNRTKASRPGKTNLNRCDACGKTESQPGEYKKCSQCNVTYYCGRTCQTDDWKKHKKVCPTLGAPKKVGKRALKKTSQG